MASGRGFTITPPARRPIPATPRSQDVRSAGPAPAHRAILEGAPADAHAAGGIDTACIIRDAVSGQTLQAPLNGTTPMPLHSASPPCC